MYKPWILRQFSLDAVLRSLARALCFSIAADYEPSLKGIFAITRTTSTDCLVCQ